MMYVAGDDTDAILAITSVYLRGIDNTEIVACRRRASRADGFRLRTIS